MYKSRESEYQRRVDDMEPRSTYEYDNSRPRYQDDVYDEDDFYGQIMRNANRNNPYRNAPRQDYETFDKGYDEPPRRTRAEATGRMPRIEEEPYTTRNTYPNERAPYPAPNGSYQEPKYTQPPRTYERTSQFAGNQLNRSMDSMQKTGSYRRPMTTPVEPFQKTGSYQREPLREMPASRTRMTKEPYMPRETKPEAYAMDQTAMRRRPMVQEELVQAPTFEPVPEISEPVERKAPMTLSEEYESQQKAKKAKIKPEKTVVKTVTETGNPYKTFVKSNLMIFLIALINMAAVSLITTSILYTQFLKNYIVQPSLTSEMIKMCMMLTPIFAYQVAGLHCGYSMMKNKIKGLKTIFKVLLFPILFIVFEIIGFICEVPYLIYAAVKMQDDDE